MLTLAPPNLFVETRDGLSREPTLVPVVMIAGIIGKDPMGNLAMTLIPLSFTAGEFIPHIGGKLRFQEPS